MCGSPRGGLVEVCCDGAGGAMQNQCCRFNDLQLNDSADVHVLPTRALEVLPNNPIFTLELKIELLSVSFSLNLYI
jgi:hypothetical protein